VVLVREDTGVAVLATWKKGINTIPGEPVMLPERIHWKPKVDPQEIVALKSIVKDPARSPTPYQVDKLRYLQWKHINDILSRPLSASYQADVIDDFKWEDWVDAGRAIARPHKRSDIRLKNLPYRRPPVSGPEDHPGPGLPEKHGSQG